MEHHLGEAWVSQTRPHPKLTCFPLPHVLLTSARAAQLEDPMGQGQAPTTPDPMVLKQKQPPTPCPHRWPRQCPQGHILMSHQAEPDKGPRFLDNVMLPQEPTLRPAGT